MNVQHLDAVLAIERQSFIAPWSRELFLEELKIPVAESSVAVRQRDNQQRVIGYVCAWIIQEECLILRIAADPGLRRAGIGRMLLEHSCEQAWAKGARVVSLEVRPANCAAVAFYKACGFVPAGVRKKYYTDTGEDAVIMIKHLGERTGEAQENSSNERLLPS